MAIDLLTEETLTLKDAAKALPRIRPGRKIHVSTLYRWISRGVSGVHLESLKLGGTLLTSREALQRFAVRLTAQGPASRAEAKPEIIQPAVEAELDRHGL